MQIGGNTEKELKGIIFFILEKQQIDGDRWIDSRGIRLLINACKFLSKGLCIILKPTVNKMIGYMSVALDLVNQPKTRYSLAAKSRKKRVKRRSTKTTPLTILQQHSTTRKGAASTALCLNFVSPQNLSNTKSYGSLGEYLSEPFDIKCGFKQGDFSSCDL